MTQVQEWGKQWYLNILCVHRILSFTFKDQRHTYYIKQLKRQIYSVLSLKLFGRLVKGCSGA